MTSGPTQVEANGGTVDEGNVNGPLQPDLNKCVICAQPHSTSDRPGTSRAAEELEPVFRDGFQIQLPTYLREFKEFWFCTKCELHFQEFLSAYEAYLQARATLNPLRSNILKIVAQSRPNKDTWNAPGCTVYDYVRGNIHNRWEGRQKASKISRKLGEMEMEVEVEMDANPKIRAKASRAELLKKRSNTPYPRIPLPSDPEEDEDGPEGPVSAGTITTTTETITTASASQHEDTVNTPIIAPNVQQIQSQPLTISTSIAPSPPTNGTAIAASNTQFTSNLGPGLLQKAPLRPPTVSSSSSVQSAKAPVVSNTNTNTAIAPTVHFVQQQKQRQSGTVQKQKERQQSGTSSADLQHKPTTITVRQSGFGSVSIQQKLQKAPGSSITTSTKTTNAVGMRQSAAKSQSGRPQTTPTIVGEVRTRPTRFDINQLQPVHSFTEGGETTDNISNIDDDDTFKPPIIVAVESLSTKVNRKRNLSGGNSPRSLKNISGRSEYSTPTSTSRPLLPAEAQPTKPLRRASSLADLNIAKNKVKESLFSSKIDVKTAAFAAQAIVSAANISSLNLQENIRTIRTSSGSFVRIVYSPGRPGSVRIKRDHATGTISQFFTADKAYLDADIDDSKKGVLVITPRSGGSAKPKKTFRYNPNPAPMNADSVAQSYKTGLRDEGNPKSPSPPRLERMDVQLNLSPTSSSNKQAQSRRRAATPPITQTPSKISRASTPPPKEQAPSRISRAFTPPPTAPAPSGMSRASTPPPTPRSRSQTPTRMSRASTPPPEEQTNSISRTLRASTPPPRLQTPSKISRASTPPPKEQRASEMLRASTPPPKEQITSRNLRASTPPPRPRSQTPPRKSRASTPPPKEQITTRNLTASTPPPKEQTASRTLKKRSVTSESSADVASLAEETEQTEIGLSSPSLEYSEQIQDQVEDPGPRQVTSGRSGRAIKRPHQYSDSAWASEVDIDKLIGEDVEKHTRSRTPKRGDDRGSGAGRGRRRSTSRQRRGGTPTPIPVPLPAEDNNEVEMMAETEGTAAVQRSEQLSLIIDEVRSLDNLSPASSLASV